MTVSINSNIKTYPVLISLFNFYENTELDLDSPYNEFEEAAEKFLDNSDVNTKDLILESNFDPKEDIFNFNETKSNDERLLWIFGFQNFYRAVNNVINDYSPQSHKDQGAERQSILKKEAFEFVGYNPPNIKTGRSKYSALFD